jgi:hypothetical protein
MQPASQALSIDEIQDILLQLNGKLVQIDLKFDPEIEKLAQETIDSAASIQKSQKEDVSKKLMFSGMETFDLLHFDYFTLLRELQDKTIKTLNVAINNARYGIDTTQYTHTQSVEITRVSSFIFGYVSQFACLAQKDARKLSIEESVVLLLRYLTQNIKKEQKKAYEISQDLLHKATKDVPTVKTYKPTFRPILGYTTNNGLPEMYQEFCQDLEKTSNAWSATGALYGMRRFKQFKPSENTFRWIV